MNDPFKALYVHVPFCRAKCSYCDFASHVPGHNSEMDAYVEAVVLALRARGRDGLLSDIETVYFGGGTPTFLGPARLTQLLYALSLSMHLTDTVECTIEANPESLTRRMVRDLWALGANRLSLGVQSFDDTVLGILGRPHSADDARRAIDDAHDRFHNVSIDLICGIPGQTPGSFLSSVQEAIALGVSHISIYPLTIEEGTPFYSLYSKGLLAAIDEDEQADAMIDASRILKQAGFYRYEVASYARMGYECRHNCFYWTGVPYLGIGSGAVSMEQNDEGRWRSQDGYILERLDRYQREAEDLMLGMRLTKGISDIRLNEAAKLLPQAPNTFSSLVSLGLVEHTDGVWQSSEKGWLLGNELYGALLDLAP